MKVYVWTGNGHYLGAAIIVIADCRKTAMEFIDKELIDQELDQSLEKTWDLKEFKTNDCQIIYSDNGDY